MKLTLFRQYYIVVICYIYFTRVVVYALSTITSYRYLWISVVAAELATLALSTITSYRRRRPQRPPSVIRRRSTWSGSLLLPPSVGRRAVSLLRFFSLFLLRRASTPPPSPTVSSAPSSLSLLRRIFFARRLDQGRRAASFWVRMFRCWLGGVAWFWVQSHCCCKHCGTGMMPYSWLPLVCDRPVAVEKNGRAKLPPGHMGLPFIGETLAFLWYLRSFAGRMTSSKPESSDSHCSS